MLEKRLGTTNPFRIAANVGYRGHAEKNPVFGLRQDGATFQLEHGDLEYSGPDHRRGRHELPRPHAARPRGRDLPDPAGRRRRQRRAEAVGRGDRASSSSSSGTASSCSASGSGTRPGSRPRRSAGPSGSSSSRPSAIGTATASRTIRTTAPTSPRTTDGFQDTKADSPPGKYGCPDPDNDEDGILDVDDRCPNNPEDRDGDEDDDGCPEGSDGDRDGDGILDSRDKCPDDPEDRDGFQDKDGCPDPDNDKDGIPDKSDQCPNDPEDKDDFEDEDGCPEPDNDRDGIPDVADKCPNDPETFNGLEDEDGCPDKGSVGSRRTTSSSSRRSSSRPAAPRSLPESFGIVQAVAETLKHHPEFTMIEVQGHANERSADAYNLKLTQARADAVAAALRSAASTRTAFARWATASTARSIRPTTRPPGRRTGASSSRSCDRQGADQRGARLRPGPLQGRHPAAALSGDGAALEELAPPIWTGPVGPGE